MCTSVGLNPATPPDECMDRVKQDVADDAVSAPDQVPALRNVVQEASHDGIDLKIVVTNANPIIDTMLRDVATVVGAEYPDATVLVLSPSYVGSYSGQFDRSKLEAAEDHAKKGNPVVSAQNFVGELHKPEFPWTAFTIAMLIGVVAVVIGTRMLQQVSKRSAAVAESPSQGD
nr:DUF6676 family protein [Mycobacterium eburneum]